MGRSKDSGLFHETQGSPQLKLENSEYEHKVKLNEEINKNKEDIEFLKNSGVKFNENEVIFVIKDKNNKPIWLETGNSSAGLKHIIKEHGEEFLANGIKDYEIKIILHKAITEGEIIGVQGKNRKVYNVVYNGREYKIAISISSNGFIVGANISSNYKETNKNEKN